MKKYSHRPGRFILSVETDTEIERLIDLCIKKQRKLEGHDRFRRSDLARRAIRAYAIALGVIPAPKPIKSTILTDEKLKRRDEKKVA